ncbi:uncharacterized protein LOC117301825 [Asterias rubens]|uniref:uncharacterized protein LOC117301825 n=1 Tax=Asterias rubens TaxID=7604 RepID=UPI001455501B|nr:uncharacterized protein LOC117301825 [Asterias rubens]
MMSNFASNPIVPFVLAGILQLFLSVVGDSCGALTIAEADDDYMSLRRKAFSNFRSTCRKAVPKQDFDECVTGTHTCDSVKNEICVNTPGGFDCVCMEGYQRVGQSCEACHFSTVPHPKPYSYMFILEPQISPFMVNFSVKTGELAMVGLSENRTDQTVIIEIPSSGHGRMEDLTESSRPHWTFRLG